jgi:hypothetical protein
LFLALYGSAGASPVEALLNSLEDILSLRNWQEKVLDSCIDYAGCVSEWLSLCA